MSPVMPGFDRKKLLAIFIIFSHQIAYSAITYQFSGGRFGDNLLSYAHAQWIAYNNNIQLLYKPFKFSDHLMLHQLETPITSSQKFESMVEITQKNCKNINFNNTDLFIVPYYSEYPHEPLGALHGFCDALKVNWKDRHFKDLLRKHIAPMEPLDNIIIPPKDCLSVALHLRKGGRADSPQANFLDPLKFPPTSFFAEQLKIVCDRFKDNKIYVFVFTDDLDVEKIKAELLAELQGYNIVMESRTVTSDTDFVLEDFFSLPNFNILIRPCSNFSFVAGKLGDYLLEVAPRSFIKINNIIYITEVDFYESK